MAIAEAAPGYFAEAHAHTNIKTRISKNPKLKIYINGTGGSAGINIKFG